jgi:hypothetical protein
MTKRYSAEDIEMENYEKNFDEFYDITPITDRAVGFYSEPLKNHTIFPTNCFKK